MTKNIRQTFLGDIPLLSDNENDEKLSLDVKDFADMSMEAVYVIDFQKRGFHFVADHNLFLCGHCVEEVLLLGCNFFPRVIHIEDLPLLKTMYKALLQRLCDINAIHVINYFSFVVRIKNVSGYLMVFHKLKPVFVDGQIRFGICLLESSVLDTPGHLRANYYNGVDFDEYSLMDRKWRKKTEQTLTKREKSILMLIKQGKTYKEVAEKLCISRHTLRNEQASIYRKLNVKTMIQAVIYATNHHLIYGFDREKREEQQPKEKKQMIRRPMMPDMIPRIQESLNKGQSVNSIAQQENVSEFTIRYAIRVGKLLKIRDYKKYKNG